MPEPTDSKAEILNGFEAFCARLGFILCYYATTLVLVVIILSVLVFSVRLTSFLESIEWGVTFFAIVLGLVINWVYDDHLTDILYQLMRKGEILAKTPMRDPINQVTTHGAVLTYLFFVFSGFFAYGGMHSWAHRVRILSGHSNRIFIPESPTATLVLFLLEIISGFWIVASLLLMMAGEIRVIRRVLSETHHFNRVLTTLQTPYQITRMISPQYPTEIDSDHMNWDFITEYSAFIGFTMVPVTVLFLGLGQVFHEFNWMIIVAMGVGLAVTIFTARMLLSTNLLNATSKRLNQLEKFHFIINSLMFTYAAVVFALTVRLLPQPSGSVPDLFVTIQGVEVLKNGLGLWRNPITYFELSRAGSVVLMCATSIPLGYHLERWRRQSSIADVPGLLRGFLRMGTWPLRVFIGKMTSTESRWNWWIQGSVLVQMFGVVLLLQAFTYDISPTSGIGILYSSGVMQILLIRRDVHSGIEPTTLPYWVWMLGCLLMPFIGGVGFVLSEVQDF